MEEGVGSLYRRVSKVTQWYEEPACQCRRCEFNPWVRKIPLEKEMATHSSILAWKSHGQRSLAGYSPWGYRELDTTDGLRTHAPPTLSLFFKSRRCFLGAKLERS